MELRGTVEWELIDAQSHDVVSSGMQDNLILNTFRSIFQDWFQHSISSWDAGDATDIPDYVAMGTSTDAAIVSDTALSGEQLRKQISSKSETSSFGARMVISLATTEANFGIKELGLVNAATDGDMYSRTIVDINKTTNETLNITWILRIT